MINSAPNDAKQAFPRKALFLGAIFSSVLGNCYGVEVSAASPRKVAIEAQTVAVTDAGLWPNLVRLSDKSLVLSAFNQPAHGTVSGEVATWISTDEGASWAQGGSISARHDASSNRMNHAVGLTGDAELTAIVGGYTDPETKKRRLMLPEVARSIDGGKTWTRVGDLNSSLALPECTIPFGNIVKASDGSIKVGVFHAPNYPDILRESATYVMASRDGGKTWEESKIADGLNETAILELRPKEWLAIARTLPPVNPIQGELRQFRSTDNGKTWMDEGLLTKANEHPANLIRLKDGRLLLSYSERSSGGIFARISEDDGLSWGRPLIVSTYKGDGGYPSSVEAEDGTIITAFYGKRSPALEGEKDTYHTAIVRWLIP